MYLSVGRKIEWKYYTEGEREYCPVPLNYICANMTMFAVIDRRESMDNSKGFTGITKKFSYISTICLFLIMLLAVVDIIGAKLFNKGVVGTLELIESLNVPLVFLAAAFVQLDRGHIRIELLQSRMPAFLRHLINIIGYITGTLMCGFFCWRTLILFNEAMEIGKSTGGGLDFPIWPTVGILVLGFGLLMLAFLISIIREVIIFRSQSSGCNENPI